MTFEHSEKYLKPITLMCGEVKGSYVGELKINQILTILVIKINILLQKF